VITPAPRPGFRFAAKARLLLLSFGFLAPVAPVAPAAPVAASPAALHALEALQALGGGDLVVFDEPHAGRATKLLLATLVKAPVDRVRALLADPAAYQRAVPAFVRAEVKQEGRQGPGGFRERRLAWELEVPLWNLKGELWMRARPDGVALELVKGDLAPGLYHLSAASQGERTLLRIEGRANLRDANFVSRRLVARSALAEPAMAATAAWVLLRALALEAERTGDLPHPRRWPTAAMRAPPVHALDGAVLGRLVAGRSPGDPRVAAVVRCRPGGRLDRVEVAVPLPVPPSRVGAHLREPQAWRALPGWGKLKPLAPVSARGRPPPVAAETSPRSILWEVDSTMPFVDFDAVWKVALGPPLRAEAVRGDWRGGVMGWDVVPTASPTATVAVYSLHPRIEQTGYIPRRFVAAEPLLEAGLALGLAYVNAVSLMQPLR
jgi:hypothetical protein